MIREQPGVITFKERNGLHNNAYKEDGERENGGRGGLDIEAGEHEGHGQHGAGIHDHEKMRPEIKPESFMGRQDVENGLRHKNEHAFPGEPKAREEQRGAAEHDYQCRGKNYSGKPLQNEESKARDGAAKNHAQCAVFGLLRHHVAANEGGVKWHEQDNLRDEHEHGHRERGNEFTCKVTVAVEHALGFLLPFGEFESEQHGILGEQEHAKADVGAAFAE